MTVASSTPHRWDAVVIGAGPAGGLAAYLLAVAGLRILLIDRGTFPRYKVCGACVNSHALAALRNAGLGRQIARLPGIPLQRFEIRSGKHRLCLPLEGGMSVAREQLDQAVVEAACGAGAVFQSETTAHVQPDEDSEEQRRVELTSRTGAVQEATARVVLVADGLGHTSVQRLPGFHSRVNLGSRVGVGAMRGGQRHGYPAGTVHMGIQHSGYVGVVRTSDETVNVAAALERRFLRLCGGPQRATETILKSAGFPELPGLESAAWQGTLPLTRSPDRIAARRVLLLGDATGYVEPFTGEGIAWAYAAAAAAIPIALAAAERWHPELAAEWERTYREMVGRRQRWCSLLSRVVRIPWAVASVMSVLSRYPVLARPLLHRIQGTSSQFEMRSS